VKQSLPPAMAAKMWRPGQSGNPNGHGFHSHSLAAQIRRESGNGAELMRFFFSVMRGEGIRMGKRGPMRTPKIEHRLAAAVWLAERGWGKAREFIELSNASENPERLELLRKLSDEDRAQMRAILQRALGSIDASSTPTPAPLSSSSSTSPSPSSSTPTSSPLPPPSSPASTSSLPEPGV
jgi:hypothetical protein